MAQFRPSGTERYFHHDGSGGGGAGGNGASEQISIRIPPHKAAKIRRRQDKALRRASLPCIVVGIFLGFLVTIFAFQYISNSSGIHGRFDQNPDDIELKNDVHDDFRPRFNRSTQINRELRFGRGSVAGGRDSRYWDRDDRRRDDEYDEDGLELPGNEGDNVTEEKKEERKLESRSSRKFDVGQGVGGLYNEAGRNELQKFEEKYKESLKNSDQTSESGEVSSTDEYDDGIDIEDVLDELENGDENQQTHNDNLRLSGSQKQVKSTEENSHSEALKKGTSIVSLGSNYNAKSGHGHPGIADGLLGKPSDSVKKNSLKKKSPKRRRISGSHCEMKLLNSSQLLEPLENKKFSRFSLQYTETEERPVGLQNWEPRFAGHQTLHEREESFYARDQKINCGFVKGPKDLPSTGFDLAEDDVKFMSSCHVAVSSCIFGNSDNLRIPYTKTITRSSRKNVCFVMFVDETTLQTLSSEGHKPDPTGLIGLWKIVVVKNLPYNDMRRVGKIPKFLAHRLFPSARYSIWLDSKLRLQSDPLLILEYFLWRKGHEYAISNHYDRHCVWEEVMQNKKLNKFNHTIIDEQFAFYQADGLKRFDPTDPNKLLPSYVPEGSFILRAHTPMSNLFSCLWFNEVDRFTPRDQLSFAYTYLKLRRMNPGKPFHLHMFKDCERRTIAKLFHHRGEDKRTIPGQAIM